MKLKTVFTLITLLYCFSVKSQDWQVNSIPQEITQLTHNQYNTISLQFPQEYDWKQVQIKTTTAKVSKSTSRGEIRVFPTAPKVKLAIYYQSNLIETLHFNTVKPIIHFHQQDPITLYRKCIIRSFGSFK